jgi:hypothetical protein
MVRHPGRLLILAVACWAAGCSSSANLSRWTGDEQRDSAYLTQARSFGGPAAALGDAGLLDMGAAVCESYHHGYSANQVIDSFNSVGRSDHIPTDVMSSVYASVDTAAITTLCPQYFSKSIPK